jgi:hypothetical protein
MGVIVGSDFSDPTNERLIYLSAAGLVLLGVFLLAGTAMWWRRGRQEHPALSPLEVMGRRSWAKAAEGDRRRRLDQVRIAGAGAASDEGERAEPVDLQALVRSVPQAFDDLREPGAVIEPLSTVEPDEVVVDVESDVDGEVAVEQDDDVAAFEVAEAAEVAEPDGDVLAAADRADAEIDPDATSLSAERPLDDLAGVFSEPRASANDHAEAAEAIDPSS